MDKDQSNTLLRVYIAQNIREEGVSRSDFRPELSNVKKLFDMGMIEEDKWRGNELYFVSTNGSHLAKSLIKDRIDENASEVEQFLNTNPSKLVTFLINQSFMHNFSFPLEEYFFGDSWEEALLKSDMVLGLRTRILTYLTNLGIAFYGTYYVSTGGGQKRGKRHVISSEGRDLLYRLNPKVSLSEKEIQVLKMHFLLRKSSKYLESVLGIISLGRMKPPPATVMQCNR